MTSIAKPRRPHADVAKRALEEARERRTERQGDQHRGYAENQSKKELGGRKGPDPARYGDWENKGIASDF